MRMKMKAVSLLKVAAVTLIVAIVLLSAADAIWPWHQDSREPEKCGDYIPIRRNRKLSRAGPGEFPFLVKVKIQPKGTNEGDSETCAGAILSPRDILTSVKCTLDRSGGLVDSNDLLITVGSLYSGKHGQQVGVAGKFQLVRDSTKSDCNRNGIPHGIAVLRLRRDLDFYFGKGVDSDIEDLKEKPKYINSVCFKERKGSNGVVPEWDQYMKLFSPQWVRGDFCAKAVRMKRAPCNPGMGDSGTDICASIANGLVEIGTDDLQEGAPLVRLNKDKGWNIIGILSKSTDLWSDCNSDTNDNGQVKFLALSGNATQTWLIDIINATG